MKLEDVAREWFYKMVNRSYSTGHETKIAALTYLLTRTYQEGRDDAIRDLALKDSP